MSNQPTASGETPGPRFLPGFVTGIAIAISLSAGGCSMNLTLGEGSMFETGQETATIPRAPGTPTYKVIFASNSGDKPQIFTGYLDEPQTVQQALDASGASKKFKGMHVDLARKVEKSGQILKLQVTYDHETSHVLERENYSIHAGDEILVRPNNPGALDAMFRTLQGG